MAFSFAATGPFHLNQRGFFFEDARIRRIRQGKTSAASPLALPMSPFTAKSPARAASRQPLSQEGHAATFISRQNMIGSTQGTTRKTLGPGPNKWETSI
jgi:hypothetical protein